MSEPVGEDKLLQIATISGNNDAEIGKLISTAVSKVGVDGVITVGTSNGLETECDVVEGMEFDKGYVSPYFATNTEKMVAELDNCQLILLDRKLSNAKDMVELLEKVEMAGALTKPLLIVAEDIENEALATLVVNKLRGGMQVCGSKKPRFW